MAENKDFSHLPLPFVFTGKPKLHGGGKALNKLPIIVIIE